MLLGATPEELGLSRPTCVTIGNFDGVHLGHQKLINLGLETAAAKSLEFVLLTFWPHPRQAMGFSHLPLTSREEKLAIMEKLGVGCVLEVPFTREFASLSADDFIHNQLLPLHPRHIVVGHDFTFGKNRRGNIDILNHYGSKYDYEASRIKAVKVDGSPVSSTRARNCLLQGDVRLATRILGRPYSLAGVVQHGFGRGTGLGFPTANLLPQNNLVPAEGVYATFAFVDGQKFAAITNIGLNPTYNGEQTTIETFLLDTNINLYDKFLRIEFMARLRDEHKFSSPDELAAQIARDMGEARKILIDAP